GRPVPDRARLCADARGRVDGGRGRRPLRGRARVRRRSQHGQAPCRRCLLGGGRHVPADPRRLRLCRGVRRRAQVPRDAALSDRADLDQSDPVLPRRACSRPAAVVLSNCSTEKLQTRLADAAARSLGDGYQSGGTAMGTSLLADIGGSKSRFALANSAGPPERVLVIENDTVADLDAAVARYLEETGACPRAATLAVAGPVEGEEIALTNRTTWRFRRREFAKRFGFSQLRVLNDFEAIAWALPQLGAAQTRPLGKPVAARAGVKVVLGPGTGLGGAALLPAGGGGRGVGSEGGEASVGPQAAGEIEVSARLRQGCGAVSAEGVLSGPGLVRLARALDPRAACHEAETIAASALAREPSAQAAARPFARLLRRLSRGGPPTPQRPARGRPPRRRCRPPRAPPHQPH